MPCVRGALLLLTVGGTLFLCGCGSGEDLVAITVTPANASATASSGINGVQFTATGQYDPSGCGDGMYGQIGCYTNKTQVLTNAVWSTSDAANTTVNSNGMATCVSPTSTPAKIVARAQGLNGLISGSALLTCN